jgi:transcriptional regulator with XRE-family HTH domain
MTKLSDKLTDQRIALRLTVTDVHKQLNREGYDVAFSTVAGWFNGSRGVRKMEHLQALCRVLQTDVRSIVDGEIEVTENAMQTAIAREIRDMSPVQQELVLALIRNMKGGQ